MLDNMAIDTIVVVVIMVSTFVLAYFLTAIVAGWRQSRRAEIDRRQRRAQQYSRQHRGWVPRG
jgi:ABC-type uncharacterized transport system YnjBCD permease subunit